MTPIIALVLLVAAEDADVARARAYFEAGKSAFESGKYAAAAVAFRESNILAPRAATVFSMGQAYRLQYLVDRDPLNLRAAVDNYRSYLSSQGELPRRNDALEHLAVLEPMLLRVEEEERRSGRAARGGAEALTQLMISSPVKGALGSLDGGEFSELPLIVEVSPGEHSLRVTAEGYSALELSALAVEGRLVVVSAALEVLPAKIDVEAPAGAEIFIDGRLMGTAPLGSVELSPGKYWVSVSKTGRYLYQREVELARGEEVALSAELEVTTQRHVAYGFLTGAALLAAAGVTGTVVALNAESEAFAFDEARARGDILTAEDVAVRERRTAKRDRWATISGVFYGGAVAAAATGVLLFVLDEPRLVESRAFEVTPLISEDGAGIGVTLRP